MTNLSNSIASLHLLESGNVECVVNFGVPFGGFSPELRRFHAIDILWDNPEFQALLDKAIISDSGGVPLE